MTIGTITLGHTVHRITRVGTRKDQGGAGVEWRCSCKANDGLKSDRHRVCYVLIMLWHKQLNPKIVKLTKDGKRILHVRSH